MSQVEEAVHVAFMSALIVYFVSIAFCASGQCSATATVNPNGTITLHPPSSMSVIAECIEYLDSSFVYSVTHVQCDVPTTQQLVLMTTDDGKVYGFNLPNGDPWYFNQWCQAWNYASFYQSIKYEPIWQQVHYNIPCDQVLSTGVLCSRLSELSFCWQHR